MQKVIICIHGRSNKPDKNTLTDWWIKSIEEGLRKSAKASLNGIGLEMAYYADIFYDEGPLASDTEPYISANDGAIKPYKDKVIDRIRNFAGNWFDNPLDWVEERSNIFSVLGREISEKTVKDVGEYYSNDDFRGEVNNTLKILLTNHIGDQVILISHSLGTIIAYEVLAELGNGFTLEHFITMGSPLGVTAVKGNLVKSHDKLCTPSCVKDSWANFSDPHDFVCLDSHLDDDYSPNPSNVQVKDFMVSNDYPGNHHKVYGYLRTPEFSNYLASLL